MHVQRVLIFVLCFHLLTQVLRVLFVFLNAIIGVLLFVLCLRMLTQGVGVLFLCLNAVCLSRTLHAPSSLLRLVYVLAIVLQLVPLSPYGLLRVLRSLMSLPLFGWLWVCCCAVVLLRLPAAPLARCRL